MIDLNTLISNALTAAITSAIAPLNERLAKLEQTLAAMHNVTDDDLVLLGQRIDVLESRPTQGVDTTLVQRIEALEDKALTGSMRGGLTRDEVDALIEQAVDMHCETYDHDSYDSAVSDFEDMPSLDDYVTRDEVRSEIEDVLNNATLSLSI